MAGSHLPAGSGAGDSGECSVGIGPFSPADGAAVTSVVGCVSAGNGSRTGSSVPTSSGSADSSGAGSMVGSVAGSVAGSAGGVSPAVSVSPSGGGPPADGSVGGSAGGGSSMLSGSSRSSACSRLFFRYASTPRRVRSAPYRAALSIGLPLSASSCRSPASLM